MEVIIMHRNQKFASYLKEEICHNKKDNAVILSTENFTKKEQIYSYQTTNNIRLILDAHMSGNLVDCEGFEYANQLRYQYKFMHPIILLTWFKWMDDFKDRSFLQKHLNHPFAYKYFDRKLPPTMVITLPCSYNEIYQQLKRY